MRHVAIGGAILFALAIIIGAFPAKAAVCGPWQTVLDGIYEEFGELPTFLGTDPKGPVMTITLNDKTGSFTIILQPNPEIMCVVGGGEKWGPAPKETHDAPMLRAGKGA